MMEISIKIPSNLQLLLQKSLFNSRFFQKLYLSLSMCRLTQVLKTEMSSKALYYFCELHRKGGSREIAKNYCNQSLHLDPNAAGPLHALGLFSFGEPNQTFSPAMIIPML